MKGALQMEKVSGLYPVDYFSRLCTKLLSFVSKIIGFVVLFLVAMSFVYPYMFTVTSPVVYNTYRVSNFSETPRKCDLFDGKWIQDEMYPLYNSSQCPFVEKGFDCLANGRKDKGYMKWRWKLKDCDIPRFNARKVLEKLRGKRVVFVGDSLSRTQWESFVCMLMTGVEDKKSVSEINGKKITRQIRFLGVEFSSFDLRVDFYRSVFLVRPARAPIRAPKRVKLTIQLDKLDRIAKEWINSDFLVFNSGHWWSPSKLFDVGCYFQVGGELKLGMPITTAFTAALDTWSSWVNTMINPNRTRVYFRTFESSHWSGKNFRSCKVTQSPLSQTSGKDHSSFSDMILKLVKKMKFPVKVLHVTPMGAYRSDGHVGTWSGNPKVPIVVIGVYLVCPICGMKFSFYIWCSLQIGISSAENTDLVYFFVQLV